MKVIHRLLIAATLAVLSMDAGAQAIDFKRPRAPYDDMIAAPGAALVCDNTNCVINRIAGNTSEPQGPTTTLLVHTTVPAESREFAWSVGGIVLSHATTEGKALHPEIAGGYFRGVKLPGATAPVWGLLGEGRCYEPEGDGCFGAEVDLVSQGQNVGLRMGMQLLLGKLQDATMPGPATIHCAICVVAMNNVLRNVNLLRGLQFNLDCQVNCVEIRPGNKMSFDGGNGDAEQLFDPATGYAGWWSSRLGLFIIAHNMTTGEERRMWKPPTPPKANPLP